jgi:hypothetical protein
MLSVMMNPSLEMSLKLCVSSCHKKRLVEEGIGEKIEKSFSGK